MPLGKPWLYKPDTKIKTLSLCPHCNCMTKTIYGACGKCMNTKIKPDWEEKELKLLKDKKILMPQLYSFEEVRKLVLYQEEQHKKEMEKNDIRHKEIHEFEVYKLKQQHIKQRKTLSDIHWEHLKRVKQQHRADLVSLIKRIEDVGLTPNGTRMIVLSNSEWIEIKEQLLNSQKGK